MAKHEYLQTSSPEASKQLLLTDKYYAEFTRKSGEEVVIENSEFGMTDGFDISGDTRFLEKLHRELCADFFWF